MPKNKTHSGAKKRFRVTGTGKVIREQTGHVHKFHEKTPQKARALSKDIRGREGRRPQIRRCSASEPRHVDVTTTSRSTHVARVKRAVNARRAPGRPQARQRLPQAALAALPQAKEQMVHSLSYALP